MDQKSICVTNNVRYLWKVIIRSMGVTKSDCEPFVMMIACNESSELPVSKLIKKRFDEKWWEDKLILDLVYQGKLHMIDSFPLYEFD